MKKSLLGTTDPAAAAFVGNNGEPAMPIRSPSRPA
jgi:hypothetical protein